MRPLALIPLCVLIAAGPLAAQSDSSPTEQEYKYVARVTGSNVNVRSRPDVRYGYRCAQISAPETVRVVSERDGWLEILPVEGCFSVVAADFVALDEDSGIGTITGNQVRIRSAGDRRTSSFNVVQGVLRSGDQVRVIGKLTDQQMQWYKIEPPLGAYWYISADFAERISDEDEPEVVRPRPQPDTTAPDEPDEPDEPTDEPDETPDEREVQVSRERKAMDAFQEAEQVLREEFRKPLPERDLSGLKEQYEAIDAPEDSTLEAYVKIRLGHIQEAMERLESYHEARSLAEQVAERQREHQLALARLQAETPRVEEVTRYDAEGVLLASEIFTGEGATPRRYTLRDTISRRINAYVQSTRGDVDLSQYVGKKVGIFGTRRYDSGLQLHVVEAERVVVLAEDPHVPDSSRPTVVPRPQLTPTTRPETPRPEPEVDEPAEQSPEQPQPEPAPDEDENGTEEPEPDNASNDDEPAASAEILLPDGLEMVTPENREEAADERPVPEHEYD